MRMKKNMKRTQRRLSGHLGVEIVVQIVPQQAVDENCLSLEVIPALGTQYCRFSTTGIFCYLHCIIDFCISYCNYKAPELPRKWYASVIIFTSRKSWDKMKLKLFNLMQIKGLLLSSVFKPFNAFIGIFTTLKLIKLSPKKCIQAHQSLTHPPKVYPGAPKVSSVPQKYKVHQKCIKCTKSFIPPPPKKSVSRRTKSSPTTQKCIQAHQKSHPFPKSIKCTKSV